MNKATSNQISQLKSGICLTATNPAEVYATLEPIHFLYPDFSKWFWKRVAPGIPIGERKLFVEEDASGIYGVVIAKNATEKKLCTVWTAPHARGRGVATRLMSDACNWLNCSLPLITIPESRMMEFDCLIQKLHFEHTETHNGYYGVGRNEFVFNGRLRPDAYH